MHNCAHYKKYLRLRKKKDAFSRLNSCRLNKDNHTYTLFFNHNAISSFIAISLFVARNAQSHIAQKNKISHQLFIKYVTIFWMIAEHTE